MPEAACCAGSWLEGEGIIVGRLHIATLMKQMGLEAIYRRPNTSKPAPGHKIYPYLLRNLRHVARQPGVGGGHQLLADGQGLSVLGGDYGLGESRSAGLANVSITLTADFCIDALQEASRHGKPEIFNTDQGSQFTATTSPGAERPADRISMDGKGAWGDNVFVERLWRTVKYEEVYLHAYADVAQARASIGRYLNFYNG